MSAGEDERVSTKATSVVGLAVLCSRLLGLIRETVIAALFGASKNMDAFLTAFRAPNMLRDLFAEGALSTAFVTTFSRRIATEGDQSAWRLASKVATLTLVFMSFMTLLGVIFAPFVIDVLAPGFPAEKAALTIQLTRIMFPFILLVSLAALVMGMLNAKNVFGIPALASSFLIWARSSVGSRFATGSTRKRTGGIRISASAAWSGWRSGLCWAGCSNCSCNCPPPRESVFVFVSTSTGAIRACAPFSP